MRVLLIGVGSPFRGDDAVGPLVVRQAAASAGDDVEVVELADPAGLLDVWDGADTVVVVDAVVSGGEPGTVVTLDAIRDPLPASGWASGGTHALGLAAAVELSRTLGRLPGRLTVVGVEVADTTPGAALTAAVSAAVPEAVAAVRSALAEGHR